VAPRLARRPDQPLDDREWPAALVELPRRVEVLLRAGRPEGVELARPPHRVDARRLGAELRGEPGGGESGSVHVTHSRSFSRNVTRSPVTGLTMVSPARINSPSSFVC